MYSKKKIIRNVILVLALFIILGILIFSLGDIKAIINVLTTQTNYGFVIIGAVCVLIYAILMQISLTIGIRHKCKGITVTDAMCISGTEYFFNGITPFSTGGQPFQAYALKLKGMKLSDSTSTLMVNFLTYQIIINIYSIVGLSIYYSRLKAQLDNLMWLVILGFTINILVMIFVILLGTTKFFGKLLLKFVKLLCKIKFLRKFIEPRIQKVEVYIQEMQDAFKEMATYKKTLIWSSVLKVFAMFIYYSIPYFIFYALGINLSWENLFYVVSMTSFALTISCWVPTPGAAGGVELAFTALFTHMVSAGDKTNLTVSAMLVWRLLTYYLLLIYGFVMYMLFERRNKDENRDIH